MKQSQFKNNDFLPKQMRPSATQSVCIVKVVIFNVCLWGRFHLIKVWKVIELTWTVFIWWSAADDWGVSAWGKRPLCSQVVQHSVVQESLRPVLSPDITRPIRSVNRICERGRSTLLIKNGHVHSSHWQFKTSLSLIWDGDCYQKASCESHQ